MGDHYHLFIFFISDKWALGISGVALTMIDNWVIGGLMSNIWSVAGS